MENSKSPIILISEPQDPKKIPGQKDIYWRAYTYTKVLPRGLQKETAIIVSPLGYSIERALHEIGLQLTLTQKFHDARVGGLRLKDALEALDQEMLTPYGMHLIRLPKDAVNADTASNLIEAFEAENWQKSRNEHNAFKYTMRDYAGRIAKRLEREKAKGHKVISTWGTDMICKNAMVWAGDFVEMFTPERSSPKFEPFFQDRLAKAEPVLSEPPDSLEEAVKPFVHL